VPVEGLYPFVLRETKCFVLDLYAPRGSRLPVDGSPQSGTVSVASSSLLSERTPDIDKTPHSAILRSILWGSDSTPEQARTSGT
jgi:hypothetical protein